MSFPRKVGAVGRKCSGALFSIETKMEKFVSVKPDLSSLDHQQIKSVTSVPSPSV